MKKQNPTLITKTLKTSLFGTTLEKTFENKDTNKYLFS